MSDNSSLTDQENGRRSRSREYFSLPGALASSQRPTAPDLLDELRTRLGKARDAYYLNEYTMAEELVADVIAPITAHISGVEGEDPDIAPWHLIHASALTLLGRCQQTTQREETFDATYAKAADMFRRWLRFAKPVHLKNYGILLFKLEKPRESISYLNHALKEGIEEDLAETYYYLGEASRLLGQLDDAERYMMRARELRPDSCHIYISLGELYQSLNKDEDAADAFQEAAYILADIGRLNEALKQFDTSLALDPNSDWALAGKGDLLRQMGRLDEAAKLLGDASQEYGHNALIWFNLALVHFENNDMEQAVYDLQQSLKIDPENVYALLNLAVGLRLLNKLDDARDSVVRAMEIAPDFPPVYVESGLLHAREEKFGEAIQDFEKTLEMDPTDFESMVNLGSIYRHKGELEKALKILGKADALRPDMPIVKLEMGQAYWDRGRYDEAELALKEAHLLDPDDHETLRSLAELYLELDRFDAVAETYKKAIDLEPTLSWAHAGLGKALYYLGELTQARDHLNTAVKLDPENTEASLYLGHYYSLLKEYEQAMEAYERVQKLEPDWIYAFIFIANTYAALGQLENAFNSISSDEIREEIPLLARQAPDDPDIRLSQALVQMAGAKNDDDYETALETTNEILKNDPDNSVALSTKGTLLFWLDQYEKANSVLQQSVRLDRNQIWIYLILGQIFLNQEEYREAITILDQALSLQSDNVHKVTALRGKAYAYLDLSKRKKALACLNQARELIGDSVDVLSDMALVYQIKDDYKQALEHVQMALEIAPDDVWALTVYGNILADIGEYEEAARVTRKIEPPDWRTSNTLGWSYENMGPDHAVDAVEAYKAVDPDTLSLTNRIQLSHNLANALRLANRDNEAIAKYEKVIGLIREQSAKPKVKVDADMLATRGWCYLQLEQFSRAVRDLTEAQNLYPGRHSTWFDLALAMLCSKRYQTGLAEYERCLEAVNKRDGLRQRGLLHVANIDLNDVISYGWLSEEQPEVAQVKEMLAATYQKVKSQNDFQLPEGDDSGVSRHS